MGFAAVAAVGAVAGAVGSSMSADAARSAADAQAGATRDYKKWVAGQVSQASSLVNNPAAMAAHDQALHAQERQVSRQEELAAAINPALIEQGKQLHSLMTGQSAPVLDNLKQQRALQRQQLVSQLREQLGPGAETSSAGQQALTRFDAETANGLSSAQAQYTQMFLSGSLQAPGSMAAAGAANEGLNKIQADSPQAAQANIMAQFAGAGAGAQQAGINAAGGSSVGQALQGQALAGLGSTAMQIGAAGYGNKSMGSKPQGGGGGGGSPDFDFSGAGNNMQANTLGEFVDPNKYGTGSNLSFTDSSGRIRQ